MFARIVSMQLKPNTHREFTEKFEQEIIPTLKKQQGFKDEILFVAPGGSEVVAISLWDSRQNAETYHRATYPEVLKTLANLVEPTLRSPRQWRPRVRPVRLIGGGQVRPNRWPRLGRLAKPFPRSSPGGYITRYCCEITAAINLS
jgi:heme-degrading monooxygenase HmoA